mgnify:CR=1 FL=1
MRWSRAVIPADIILREDRAMNTGENVIFSLPVIDASARARQHPQRDLSRQYLDARAAIR